MSIDVGEKLPAATFKVKTETGLGDITSDELFSGKKVVVFAVLGKTGSGLFVCVYANLICLLFFPSYMISI